MAKTLLNSVNEVLKRVGTVSGESGELTSLTDSPRQRHIDVAIQAINEVIDELYSATTMPMPQEQGESTITLVTDTNGYALATDLVQLRWPMVDKTNTQYLFEYAGGYNQMLIDDPEQDDTGLPYAAAIRATDAKLHLDRTPTSVENGRVYTYQYDKDVALSTALDEVPFSNAVFRSMVPAWVQIWKREMRSEFDADLFKVNMGRAARYLSMQQQRTSWSPR